MKTKYYSPADFIKSSKYDVHTHYHTFDDFFLRKAKKANIRILSINTNFDFPIDTQFEICQYLHKRHPETFNFLCTFDATAISSKTFAENSVEHIQKCVAAGARGVKIWKNIGMALKNDAGQYVMADDPVFAPIFAYIEKEKIPLMAHLGEPRNCWLPLEQITINDDRDYFSNNPNYHMYLHHEAPSYEQQIEVRDRILERYPDMIFIGAHLGSMEWSFEELAKRLDRFPNFYVDLSGRFAHIFEHTIQNRKCVIDFFQTYQNRILYGTDNFVFPSDRRKYINFFYKYFHSVYLNLFYRRAYQPLKKHWMFLATDKIIETGKINNESESPDRIKGLRLSKDIVDRIFYENAIRLLKF